MSRTWLTYHVVAISEHERKQVMAHTSSDVFDRNYLSQHVRRDVQKLYQGQTEHPIVRTAAQMSTYMNARAPQIISTEQRVLLKNDPTIVQLKQSKHVLLKAIQSKYGKLQKAQGTDLHQKYQRAKLDLQAEERAQRVAMKIRCREDYFEDIHTQNLERQLGGTLTNFEINNTESSISRNYVFPERERIAKMFFLSSKPVDEEDLMARRRDCIGPGSSMLSTRNPG